jgi:Gpi18-like mannosyltransferase
MKRSNINKIVLILCSLIIIACVLLLFPQIRQLIINLAEQSLGRELQDHAKWHGVLFRSSIATLILFGLFILIAINPLATKKFLIFMRKDFIVAITSGPNGVFPFTVRVVLTVGLSILALPLIQIALMSYTRGSGADYVFALAIFLLLTTTLMTVLLLRGEPVRMAPFLLVGIILLLAVFLRAVCLNHVSGDYTWDLSRWMAHLRTGEGLAKLDSDYNVPYLYILAIFSYISVDDLLLIKFVSIGADLLAAWVATALAREMGLDENKRILILAGVLFAPTVWLNSAFWGQCDVLYVLFALLCFLYVLRGRPWRAVIMVGLGFAFKLQVVFFLPMLIVFLMMRRIRWKHLLAFPGIYLLICLPALVMGRSPGSLFTIYSLQVTEYSSALNLNSPSAYALLNMENNAFDAPFFAAGIIAAAFFLMYLLYWLSQRKEINNPIMLLTLALLFSTAIPWLLPSMHERYFYMADVFAVIYAVVRFKRFYIAPMMIYASYAGYHRYLFRVDLPFGMWLPSLMVVFVIGFLIADLREQINKHNYNIVAYP